MKATLFLVVAVITLTSTLVAAEDSCEALVLNARNDPHDPVYRLKAVLDATQTPACVAELLLVRQNARIPSAILLGAYKSATQPAQQNGSSSGSGGSTNLVSKSLTSEVLSVASEYGALTESSSGQTTTVSGSLDGIPIALSERSSGLVAECGQNILTRACVPNRLLDVLGRISYSVAFNTTQASHLKGNATGPVQGTIQSVGVQSTGSPANVSQITGKFAVLQPKVAFSVLTKDTSSVPGDGLRAAAKVLWAYQQMAGQMWLDWRDSSAQTLSQVPPEKVTEEWRKLGNDLVRVLESGAAASGHSITDDELTQAAVSLAAAFAAFGGAERSFFESKLSKPIISFEYDENRPTSQPSNSVFRLIYTQNLNHWTLIGNAAASIYDSTPSSSIPGSQRLRDIQVAFEGDRTLPKWGILGTPTLSVAYYFQDQTSPAILNVTPSGPVSGVTFTGLSSNATQVFAQKGKISIGQLRISLGSSKSGLRFPIAITGSSRTELITASKLGGQIGISYDFDSLFTK